MLTIVENKTDSRSDLMENVMSDGPDSLVLRFLRTIDGKLDRVLDEVSDLKVRVTNVESNLVALNRRVDRFDSRAERIERRLGLAEGSA